MKKILVLSFLIVIFVSTAFGQCMEAKSDEGVSVVGYIQAEYNHQFLEDTDLSRFSFNRARLGLIGSIPYDFSYYIMYEFSPTKGTPYLLDGFITYSRLAPELKISMGRFKSPFGLELNTPCQGLYTINRSQVVNALTSPGRDVGIWFYGGYEKALKMKYNLALTNGDGTTNYHDAEQMSVTGRLTVNPIEMLQIGGSYRQTMFLDSLGESRSFNRIGAELQFTYEGFMLQGEYIMGKGYMETPEATAGGTVSGGS